MLPQKESIQNDYCNDTGTRPHGTGTHAGLWRTERPGWRRPGASPRRGSRRGGCERLRQVDAALRLAGLRQPDGGTVAWGDHADVWDLGEPDITLTRRATCGFVFQFPAFLDDMTIAANVAVPLVVSGTKPRDARKRARDLLDKFGLGRWRTTTRPRCPAASCSAPR